MPKLEWKAADAKAAVSAAAAARVDWLAAVQALDDYVPFDTSRSRLVWEGIGSGVGSPGYNERFLDPKDPNQVVFTSRFPSALVGANLRSFAIQFPANQTRVGPLAGLPFMFATGSVTRRLLTSAVTTQFPDLPSHKMTFIADGSSTAGPVRVDDGTLVIENLGDKASMVASVTLPSSDPFFPDGKVVVGGTAVKAKAEMVTLLARLASSAGWLVKSGPIGTLLASV